MNLEEAIQAAIQYETRIHELYLDSATRARDETGRKVLSVLAREEKLHLDHLERKLGQWQREGKVTPERLRSGLPPQEKIAESFGDAGAKLLGADQAAELGMLKRALQVEQETSGFYRKLVSELPPEGQALFEPFLEAEEAHLAIVQAEIDNLQGLGYWMDIQEFDLEAG
jgi:rubrerythrin